MICDINSQSSEKLREVAGATGDHTVVVRGGTETQVQASFIPDLWPFLLHAQSELQQLLQRLFFFKCYHSTWVILPSIPIYHSQGSER